ncbi:retrotransposon like protein, partial [Chrysochromulina tobinii]
MLPSNMRKQQTDGTRLEIINQLAQVDPNICEQYELRMTALGTSAPSNMDNAVALIEEILRTRAARAKLAALSGGAKQLGLVAGNATVADRDPTKNKPGDEKKTKKTRPPRRPDGSKKGELIKWVEGMDLCKCGGKHLYRDCPDPKTKAWFDASKAKKDAEKAKTALAADAAPAAAPTSALVAAGGGVGATTTVTISGDHTTDERALLAQLSGFLNSAAPSKVVHWSETTKAAHSANVAKTKVIDGVVQLVEPSPDELSLAAALGIATADFDPSNTRCPDFVPGCSGTCARQYETDTADSASSDDEPDPAPRCEECADNPDERLFSRVLKFLPHFWACIVTGMLLGLDPMDRELLDDDVQLMFVVHDCVEVKRDHSARTIQGATADEALRQSSLDPAALEALVAGAASKHPASPIGILKLHPDSGCTGSNTPHLHLLANHRPCDEIYSQANGNISRCEAIGDLPVIVRNKQGATVQLTFTNVRCVPDFKFSLLSVKQLWNEQGIDARFCDINALVLPNQSGLIPYDPARPLSTINAVPCAHVAVTAHRAPPPATQTALASLGFHQVGSTSHLAKLSGVQIGALMHRRNHSGIHKIKACVHASKDGPKNLGAAVQPTCLDCAATRIKAAAHSGRREPCTEPGTLHIDLKEFARSYGGYQYALIAVDEHTRYIFTQCLRHKSEALDAVKRVVAEFNAIVGTRLDADDKPLPRPTVRTIMSDREGKLTSHAFNEFRAYASLHHNTSAPHDHDLNGIAERAIGAVSETAAALLHSANATVLEWPWLIRYAVDWHNSLIGDTGTSSADPQISPFQRLTHKLPAIMDLARYGCRAVVLKPPNQQNKTALDSRGWVGTFCGRSVNSPGCWDVNCNGTIVSSSSVQVDEEHMPRLGSQAHQPLPPTAPSVRVSPPDSVPHLDNDRPVAPAAPSAAPINASVHHERPARKALSLLNLFSGPYHRTDGLAAALSAHGWTHVTQIDNDAEVGGGWQHDVLNDATYTKLLTECSAGQYDALMIAFPCSTFSVSRFFDATVDGHDSGPPVVRDHDHPDGVPELDPKHVKELKTSNLLLERTVELALAAHRSPSKATIILENPADRSIRGSSCFSEDLAKHGSLFATSAVARLIAGLEHSSTATFAYCRLGSDFQKYTTLLYTNDAAPVLDDLNQHNYQCNHPRGSHNKVGGR